MGQQVSQVGIVWDGHPSCRHAVMSHNKGAPKMNVFGGQEVSLSNESKTKI